MSVIVLVLSASQIWAHHSYAAFDMNKRLLVKGTVKSFQWVNPHCWLQVVVPNTDGAPGAVWDIEAGTPNVNARKGWKPDDIHVGDRIEAVLSPLKDGNPGGSLISVTLPDGRVLRAR